MVGFVVSKIVDDVVDPKGPAALGLINAIEARSQFPPTGATCPTGFEKKKAPKMGALSSGPKELLLLPSTESILPVFQP